MPSVSLNPAGPMSIAHALVIRNAHAPIFVAGYVSDTKALSKSFDKQELRVLRASCHSEGRLKSAGEQLMSKGQEAEPAPSKLLREARGASGKTQREVAVRLGPLANIRFQN
jgi:hypothetical protein